MGSTIAGIDTNLFPQLLDFLENRVNTKLLVYDSCFAGGKNDQMAFSNKGYSYAIVSAALGDYPTISFLPLFDGSCTLNPAHLTMAYHKNFDSFIERAELSETHKYEAVEDEQELQNKKYVPLKDSMKAIIEPIINTIGEEPSQYDSVLGTGILATHLDSVNGARVRLPGCSWFSLIDEQARVASLGKIMIGARKPIEPLKIAKYFQHQIDDKAQKAAFEAILVHLNEIPFPLDLSSIETMPRIISMVPGHRSLHMAELIAPQFGVGTIVRRIPLPYENESWVTINKMQVRNYEPVIDREQGQNAAIEISHVLANFACASFMYNNQLFTFDREEGEFAPQTSEEDVHMQRYNKQKSLNRRHFVNLDGHRFMNYSKNELSFICSKLRHQLSQRLKEQNDVAQSVANA